MQQLPLFDDNIYAIDTKKDEGYLDNLPFLVRCPERLAEVYQKLEDEPIYSLDVETTGLNPHRDKLHGIAFGFKETEYYVCHDALQPLLEHLRIWVPEHPDQLMLAHNALYDFHFLYREGIRPPYYADTMIAAALADENQELALKTLAHTKLGYPADMPEYKDLLKETQKTLGKKLKPSYRDVTIYELPIDKLADYASRDGRITYDLWQVLLYDLHVEGMEELFWNIEMPFLTRCLLEMERNGIYVDQRETDKLEVLLKGIMDENMATWNEVTGGVNPDSTQQLRKYLFEDRKFKPERFTEKTGLPSTDVITLQRLKDKDKTGAIKALMDYRKAAKLMSTYVEVFRDVEEDGRLKPSYNQAGTVTWRLSSERPNAQNMPAHGKLGKQIRGVFTAQPPTTPYRVAPRTDRVVAELAPGIAIVKPEYPLASRDPFYSLVVIDLSQAELRLIAHYSQEPYLMNIFLNNEDPHQATAEMVGIDRHIGKAQPLDAPVLTPLGWKAMGEIRPGDYVVGSNGKPTKVIDVFPQGKRPIYRITTSDGGWVEADAEHLWSVRNKNSKFRTMTTREMLDIGVDIPNSKGTRERRWVLPSLEPVEFEPVDLPLDPYVLGVLLGDGSFSTPYVHITNPDLEVVEEFRKRLPNEAGLIKKTSIDYYVSGSGRNGRGHLGPVKKALIGLGLMGKKSNQKFIPDPYLIAPVSDRLQLLHGLMDTDGTVTKDGHVSFTSTSEMLANGVANLVRSLGGTARVSKRHEICCLGYINVTIFLPNLPVFHLKRKQALVKDRTKWNTRKIDSIEYVGEKEAQCILVDAPDHLYVTKDFIVTHNTINFLIAYMGGARTLADTVEKNGYPRPSEADCRVWLNKFKENTPVLHRYMWDVIRDATRTGYVQTILGHKRRLPDLQSPIEKFRNQAQRQAFNVLIQGGIGGLMKHIMLDISPWLPWYEARMLFQIHDELGFEVPTNAAGEFALFAQKKMVSVKDTFDLRVPIIAEPNIAYSWKEAKG